MMYRSTRGTAERWQFGEAVTLGIAPDGGLFLPENLPAPKIPVKELAALARHERITALLAPFIDSLPADTLRGIVEAVFNFPIVTRTFDDSISILELFHGPTLAFKDFGARFLAKTLAALLESEKKDCVILVATSGDTGSAVAQAFYGIDSIRVALLYPSGKVSALQERQLTTFDKNIAAFEVSGTFDDCQRLVKTAFADEALKRAHFLTSANSINIARLLPQAMYYVESFIELYSRFSDITFVVPSGNLGNLTAGLFAARMAHLPVFFVSAMNGNRVFLDYLESGTFLPKESIPTLSNAMDVGNPSNLERIISLFPAVADIASLVRGFSFSDAETLEGIREFNAKYNHIIDPHTAVGYLGARRNLSLAPASHHIVLATAHPAKFPDVIEKATGIIPETPERLAAVLAKPKRSIESGTDYPGFRQRLLDWLE